MTTIPIPMSDDLRNAISFIAIVALCWAVSRMAISTFVWYQRWQDRTFEQRYEPLLRLLGRWSGEEIISPIEEKPKRRFILGDDGELQDVDEKPKRGELEE